MPWSAIAAIHGTLYATLKGNAVTSALILYLAKDYKIPALRSNMTARADRPRHQPFLNMDGGVHISSPTPSAHARDTGDGVPYGYAACPTPEPL